VARGRRRFAVKRSRDLVWITTMVDNSILELAPTDICLVVTAADWSTGNAGFDRCTLLGVRGWLAGQQSAIATAGENTAAYAALYVTDAQVAVNSMDPAIATEYALFDTLWTGGFGLNGSAYTQAPSFQVWNLEVKTKRKMSTSQDLRLAANVFGADTGTPRVGWSGCIRALLRLDPPG